MPFSLVPFLSDAKSALLPGTTSSSGPERPFLAEARDIFRMAAELDNVFKTTTKRQNVLVCLNMSSKLEHVPYCSTKDSFRDIQSHVPRQVERA